VIIDMSNQANNNNGKCKTDLAHDIARLPDGVAAKGAFEAVFLGNMLAHIDGECMNDKKIIIKQQCKTQLPDIHSKNWCKWLTAVDQENQISLTHLKGVMYQFFTIPLVCVIQVLP
jgi:hypothetical protein